MKHLVIAVILFLSSSCIFSQETHFTVTGKVFDIRTKAPLAGASVFAQNTTFGVASDLSGNFKLKLPLGGYVLVVTFTGYETESMRISNSADVSNIMIELKPKEKSMEEVSIVSSNEVKDGWVKYGQFFTDNFIGKSDFSKQVTIKNPEVLKFYFSKKRNRLKVLATEPVLVMNDALGYNVKFAIDSFTYEYNTNASLFIGYPLFEEMKGDTMQQQRWKEYRKMAYQGSLLHFMRALYNKTIAADGFEIQFLIKNNDNEKALVLSNAYAALNYSKDDSTRIVEFSPNQPDIIVLYKNAPPPQAYLDFDPKAKKEFQVSQLTIAQDQSIYIEQNGYFYQQSDVIVNGYWGFQKVGDMLPYDYSDKE